MRDTFRTLASAASCRCRNKRIASRESSRTTLFAIRYSLFAALQPEQHVQAMGEAEYDQRHQRDPAERGEYAQQDGSAIALDETEADEREAERRHVVTER